MSTTAQALIAAVIEPEREQDRPLSHRQRLVDGASFALDVPELIPAIWGSGSEVLWASGEPLLIVGNDGTGKTTLEAWLLLGLLGLVPEFLGFPIAPVEGRVVLVAADRPAQIRRRFRQIVGEEERERLAERLLVHVGPLDIDLTRPASLAAWALEHEARVLILDSLGAQVPGLAKDEVGSAVAASMHRLMAEGVELLALFHPRKATPDNRRPAFLEDVYGSRWLTAAAGSVISLWGAPGDPLVELRHLKQPASEVGPFSVSISAGGYVSVAQGSDLLALLTAANAGLTTRAAARALYGVPEPTAAQVEKARRKLEGYVGRGLAYGRPGERPKDPTTYFAMAPAGVQEALR